jgi:hypothetical protein
MSETKLMLDKPVLLDWQLFLFRQKMVASRVVNIAAMNDEIVIGNKKFCSSDYRAIDFKISIDR